jgi:single-stranded-DNA-specific exonuclease
MREIVARPVDDVAYAALISNNIDPRLAKLYAGRGVSSIFALNTKLDGLLAPSLLLHIERAGRYLADAIQAKKSLLIVADYDADGATACALGIRALRSMGGIVDYIVPNRFTLGYGLTPAVVELAANHHAGKPDVIITVDNGIASVDGVAAANRYGIDVVVTDHHLPGQSLPDAAVIVNPNQHGDTFPAKSLAGVGVMFYTMLALRSELRQRNAFNQGNIGGEPNLADLLDLVALGTVADVVKLEHNNRILVEQGLQRIRVGRCCKGIAALLQVAGRDRARVSTYDLGFVLGPRINAAGRLEDMGRGIACLLTDDTQTATKLAAELDHLNRERRTIEADMKEGALATLDTIDLQNRYALALFEPDWHQGVVGILAGRMREKTHRPVIAFALDAANHDFLKGSGRSIPALHMRDALDLITKRFPDLIDKFGGHAMAAGLTIRLTALPDFAKAFEQVAREMLTPTDLQERIETDGDINANGLDFEFVRTLETQVWGHGFVAPCYRGEFKVVEQRVVGEKHLKLKLSSAGETFDAMRFGSAESLNPSIDAVFRPSINTFRGASTVQLLIDHVA